MDSVFFSKLLLSIGLLLNTFGALLIALDIFPKEYYLKLENYTKAASYSVKNPKFLFSKIKSLSNENEIWMSNKEKVLHWIFTLTFMVIFFLVGVFLGLTIQHLISENKLFLQSLDNFFLEHRFLSLLFIALGTIIILYVEYELAFFISAFITFLFLLVVRFCYHIKSVYEIPSALRFFGFLLMIVGFIIQLLLVWFQL